MAGQFGLSVDEAHYVLYGKIPAWSYFDHPPLVGWIQGLFQLLPFEHLLKSRLSAIIVSILTSFLLIRFLLKRGFSEAQAVLSVIALNLTPLFNTMSVAMLPDTLLMPLTLLIIDATETILDKPSVPSVKTWLYLGLWLGLAGLAKYTAFLYVVSLVLLFFFRKRFKEILRPGIWAGVTLALLLVSPVLYWNIQNDWISLKYQSNHVFTFDSSLLKNLAASAVIQLLSWGVGPFLLSLWFFFRLLRELRTESAYLTTMIFLSVFLVFFIYIGFATPLLPHWMLIFFIICIPLTYAHLLKEKKHFRLLITSVFISATLSLSLLFELGYKIFPIRYTAPLYEGIIGWEYVIKTAQEKLRAIQNPKKALAVMNWTLGSRAMYYNDFAANVFVIDQRFDQFDIWEPEPALGYDLVAIIEAAKLDEHLPHLNCAQLTPIGENETRIKDVPVNRFLYYHCANFSGYK